MPAGMPTPIAISSAMTASCRVTGSFSATSEPTELLSRIDSPRLPVSTPFIQ